MDELNEQKIPEPLADELARALESMTYGSIELIVQDKVVTQITVRNIKKTSVNMKKTTESHISVSTVKNRISSSGKIHIKIR